MLLRWVSLPWARGYFLRDASVLSVAFYATHAFVRVQHCSVAATVWEAHGRQSEPWGIAVSSRMTRAPPAVARCQRVLISSRMATAAYTPDVQAGIRRTLNSAIRRQGITLVAQRAGISRSSLMRWMSGASDLSQVHLGAVLSAVGYRVVSTLARDAATIERNEHAAARLPGRAGSDARAAQRRPDWMPSSAHTIAR